MSLTTVGSLFFPTHIGTYRLLAQRIVSIALEKTTIHVSVVYTHGRTTRLEQSWSVTLPASTGVDYQERLEAALHEIKSKVGSYDVMCTMLPGSVAFIRELTLPFASKENIALVIGHEVSSLLPVPLEEVVFDFIITSTNPITNEARVLVVAVQKHIIAEHVALLERAQLDPDVITIDLVALYHVAHLIPEPKDSCNTLVLDIGLTTTRLVGIQPNTMPLLRTLSASLLSIAKDSAAEQGIKPTEALDILMRIGSASQPESPLSKALEQSMQKFCQEIQRTIGTTYGTAQGDKKPRLFILDNGMRIPALENILATTTDIVISPLTLKTLIDAQRLTTKTPDIPNPSLLTIANALFISHNTPFNLRTQEFKKPYTSLFVTNIVLALSLCVILFTTLFVNRYKQVTMLRTSLQRQQQLTINRIKEVFTIEENFKRVGDALDEAKRLAEQQETTWFSFSDQTRASFLTYLAGLSQAINKEALGLKLKRLTITPHTITIQGNVKGWDVGGAEALDALENALRDTQFFVDVPRFQDTVFTEQLVLKKQMGEPS